MDTLRGLEDCLKPASEAMSIPPKCYTAPGIAATEIDQIFRKGWFGVGRADVVSSPGDFVTLDLAGQSIVLLRDKDHSLRAFANSCRHRGARLVDGAGQCKGLRCPFHSWFYGLDGRLISAPKMDEASAFDRADYGLTSYHVAERTGFVFLCLSRDAPDLDGTLGSFERLHVDWPLSSLVTIRRQEFTVDCNWKMFLEVFNEYYHLPFVHTNSIDSLYGAPNPADDVEGSFASQFGVTDGTGGLLESDQEHALPAMPELNGQAAHGARYTWVFPNMTFAANRDALWCYEAYPLGADRCRVVQSACFPPQTTQLADFEKKSEAYLARLDAALHEDLEALINQQAGMSCPDAQQGRFQPHLEANVAAFARWYADRLKMNE